MPVSELQELCAKNGLKNPIYRLVRTEGNSHSPFFTIECLLNDVVIGEGFGKTKKGAKHSAAQKGLECIKEQSLVMRMDAKDLSKDFIKLRVNDSDKCESSGDSGVSIHDKNEVQKSINNNNTDPSEVTLNKSMTGQANGVSILQEFCAKNGFQPPVYSEAQRIGACHEPIFCISCQIVLGSEPMTASASGKTKQIAKRLAAEEVLKLLQQREYPLFPVNNIQKKKSRYNSQQSVDSNYEQQKEYKEYIDFVESLEFYDLDSLLDATDTDFCLRFNIIAEKLNCFANYITLTDDKSKSNNNKFKCLLQLKRNTALTKRLPMFVSWGNSPVSAEQAMQKAAQKAIIMVRVLKM
ncbi:unnamed protein product [Medioppia subpectinata]|uniref:DRBM domain-containing protein n=1 Tax=Medioppia subpectinata TaxID=1979941 RepID=A0A7R9QC23_9ACAR|nr:unnamed protein product [Medioppia subpectinata]CAG2118048.1 unnamed protein product [Medioppia subpectinata]